MCAYRVNCRTHIHRDSIHAGACTTDTRNTTLAVLAPLIKGRSIVKQTIHHYVPCTRERAAVPSQLMGNLPPPRISTSVRAFLHCGTDYAEPVFTRTSSRRGIASRKGYIALFICLATRAIHLELVSDYLTSAFLNAFSRFCARRGDYYQTYTPTVPLSPALIHN